MATSFFIEPTEYGWSVRKGSERLGLFITQLQALNDVEKRRAKLKAIGRDSTLSVTGSDPQTSNNRPARAMWTRR